MYTDDNEHYIRVYTRLNARCVHIVCFPVGIIYVDCCHSASVAPGAAAAAAAFFGSDGDGVGGDWWMLFADDGGCEAAR